LSIALNGKLLLLLPLGQAAWTAETMTRVVLH